MALPSQIRWYLRSRRVQVTVPIALILVIVATRALATQSREVAHIIGAASLPAVAPTLMLIGISTESRQIERTFPQRLLRWDAVLVASVGCLTALAIWWLMRSTEWAADYTLSVMVIRSATFVGLLLLMSAVTNPSLSWIVTVVVLAATLRPFLQTPNLITDRPNGLFWWPTLPLDSRVVILAIASFLCGVVMYTASRRWATVRLPGFG